MNKRWASEGECVEALGLSHSVLTRLRASGDLVAGDHWIWIGGQRNGKVGYDLVRIETWQRERTAQIVRVGGSQMNPSRARRAADLVIPLQEPNPLPSARSVPKACTAFLGADPVAAASA